VAAALRQGGLVVDLGVGMSHFRCDLAVRRHGELKYRLGILVDSQEHYRQDDLLEREMMRPELLRSFGWPIAHVLSTDWTRSRQAVIDGLMRAIEEGASPPQEQDEVEDCWDEFDGQEAPPVAIEAATQPQTPSSTAKRYFEFVGGTSHKFWEIDQAGNTVIVRFGRIGTSGQTQQKIFANEATAATTAQRLVREKLGKGYVEKSGQGPSA
jgi:predicted DNA-binding WGR domain protein